MLPTPVAPSRRVLEQLTLAGRSATTKVSLYVSGAADVAELDAALSCCWSQRPVDESPMLLRAVLRHLHTSCIDLLGYQRGGTAGFACFARLDGSVHEDTWIELPGPHRSTGWVGPRFRIEPLRRLGSTEMPARSASTDHAVIA